MVKTTSILLATACLLVAAEAKEYHTKVVILGGGVSGISAALNLTAAGITDFMMVEARDILGGRAQDTQFGDVNVELGCNWVQGLGTNPINQLALKYNLSTAFSDSTDVQWYGEKGKYNGTDTYNSLDEKFDKFLDIACKRKNSFITKKIILNSLQTESSKMMRWISLVEPVLILLDGSHQMLLKMPPSIITGIGNMERPLSFLPQFSVLLMITGLIMASDRMGTETTMLSINGN